MASNISKDDSLALETIKKCKEALEKAEPYTEEEAKEIFCMYDDDNYDSDRLGAYLAQELLKEYGLL